MKMEDGELREYFKEIRKNVTTLAEAKEASKKKWLKIYEEIDNIDFYGGKTTIWDTCGLCNYKDNCRKNCEHCPLGKMGACNHQWKEVNNRKPLYKIMDKIWDNGEKPNPQDILDFIKQIESIEVEDNDFKAGDTLKQIRYADGDPIVKVIRVEGDTVWHIHRDCTVELSSAKENFERVDEKFDIWTDVTKDCVFNPRYDHIGYVLVIYHEGNIIGHLKANNDIYICTSNYKYEINHGYFKILKEV